MTFLDGQGDEYDPILHRLIVNGALSAIDYCVMRKKSRNESPLFQSNMRPMRYGVDLQ